MQDAPRTRDVRDPAHPLRGATIVVGVTGGIAAYKAAELVRLLEAGSILHVEKGSGTAPAKYALADCDCDRCKSHRL